MSFHSNIPGVDEMVAGPLLIFPQKQIEKSASTFMDRSRCRTKEELRKKLMHPPVASGTTTPAILLLPWSYYD